MFMFAHKRTTLLYFFFRYETHTPWFLAICVLLMLDITVRSIFVAVNISDRIEVVLHTYDMSLLIS